MLTYHTKKGGKYMKETGYPSIDKKHLDGTKFIERHPIIPSISLSNAMDLTNINKQNDYIIDCLDLRVKYKELKEDAKIISQAFSELGVKNKDIICISTPNLYQSVVCFKAANRIGATVTFLNSHAPIEETEKYLNIYNSTLFITSNTNIEYNNHIIKNTKVKNIITIDPNLINKKDFNDLNATIGYNNLLEYHNLDAVARFYNNKFVNTIHSGKNDSLILYTSGSTGEPKSLLFTNENILSACIYYKNSARLPKVTENNRRWMGVVPFMYPYGFIASTLAPILAGRESIICPDVSSKNISYYYDKKPNLIFGSPAFLELTKRNIKENQDLSSLNMFVSGGDFLSVEQSKSGIEFFDKHNAKVDICNSSGNGEICGCATNAMNIDYRPETVGKLAIGPKFIIINPETKEEVKYGEKGVLCVAGKHVFKGYYNNEELTKETMIDINGEKYYITGNYGYVDNDSYFHMIGRSSRFYIMSSLNKVYCEHVQNILSNVDVVDSCAVVPKPDDELLYTSKAYVVLKEGIEESEFLKKYIIDKCKKPVVNEKTKETDVLQPYEVPTSVTFIKKLPRNEADKVDYEYLKENAKKEYENEKRLAKKRLK